MQDYVGVTIRSHHGETDNCICGHVPVAQVATVPTHPLGHRRQSHSETVRLTPSRVHRVILDATGHIGRGIIILRLLLICSGGGGGGCRLHTTTCFARCPQFGECHLPPLIPC